MTFKEKIRFARRMVRLAYDKYIPFLKNNVFYDGYSNQEFCSKKNLLKINIFFKGFKREWKFNRDNLIDYIKDKTIHSIKHNNEMEIDDFIIEMDKLVKK